MIELYVYSTMMSLENQGVFRLLKEVTLSVLSIFCIFSLCQFCLPLIGFFWFVPGTSQSRL